MRILLVVALLAIPAAGALPVALAQLPQGCEQDGDVFVCRFERDTTASTDAFPQYRYDVPVFEAGLVTITVVLDGIDAGWAVALEQWDENGFNSSLAAQRHVPSQDGGTVHVTTTAHVVHADLSLDTRLNLIANNVQFNGGFVAGVGPASRGVFVVTYTIEPLSEGTPPSRPAATRDDPHIEDGEDARRPEVDIVAAWLDDRALGDGVFEARIALADLSRVELNATPGAVTSTEWRLEFTLGDVRYAAAWEAFPNGTGAPALRCGILALSGPIEEPRGDARCAMDAAGGTLSMAIPERTAGDPRSGEPFGSLVARSMTNTYMAVGPPTTQEEDVADRARYAFALGGPEVWSELNPRLDPPLAPTAAWHEAPLARDNLPDTLSVLGALLAGVTFLVGFVAIRRNRRQTRELLARVDALVAAHEADARAALVELGKLETDFTALYRAGSINESQYQLASQRVVAAASRMALRRELGLDDGAPDATQVRVDVKRSL